MRILGSSAYVPGALWIRVRKSGAHWLFLLESSLSSLAVYRSKPIYPNRDAARDAAREKKKELHYAPEN